jgi:hypothetical protein
MDFFSVPTPTFGVLYCFCVIAHDRRRVLQFNVARHPTSAWVMQQLREASSNDTAPGYLIFDRGSSFNEGMIDMVRSLGIQRKQTSFWSPWQNGIAERFVCNCRRDLLDHMIVLNERHLKRLMNEYARYYLETRLISVWRRKYLPEARRKRVLAPMAMPFPCRDCAACIIAITSRPD